MLRPATEADVDVIRRWRNHPKVRRSSFTTHEIGPVEHRAWWAVVSAEETRRVLIYERAGVPAGVVIFAGVGSEVVEWSKYVDVDGLGSERARAWEELEREAAAYAFGELGAERIGAATLAENTPVLRLHARTGFVETRRWVTEIDGEPREVVWNELSAHRWRERESEGR
ncbi:GNAT family N-acetyltransferase [Saccharomonospora saliphila]|uniref:GNAT family N-acetyltransferase n=1 Tax=Saccharomonospora saliphila TaxID=369829 RepID=UPI000371ABC9|nr:GNAT family N-acetyltransferase [Saccharomonospora saliphila]